LEGYSADGVECQVEEPYRSACFGAADYKHADVQHCILHLPSEDKEADFKEALEAKLEKERAKRFWRRLSGT
jgi:hypothetical protein